MAATSSRSYLREILFFMLPTSEITIGVETPSHTTTCVFVLFHEDAHHYRRQYTVVDGLRSLPSRRQRLYRPIFTLVDEEFQVGSLPKGREARIDAHVPLKGCTAGREL